MRNQGYNTYITWHNTYQNFTVNVLNFDVAFFPFFITIFIGRNCKNRVLPFHIPLATSKYREQRTSNWLCKMELKE